MTYNSHGPMPEPRYVSEEELAAVGLTAEEYFDQIDRERIGHGFARVHGVDHVRLVEGTPAQNAEVMRQIHNSLAATRKKFASQKNTLGLSLEHQL